MSLPEPHAEPQGSGERAPGVIDTLGSAFALLSRRPYLVWLPILLDLLLWSGLRVSIVVPTSWLDSGNGTWPGGIAQAMNQLRNALESTELVQMVGALTPMLISDLGSANVPGLNVLSQEVISGDVGILLVAAGVLLMVFTGMSYLTMVGRLITNDPAWGVGFVRDCLSNSFRIVGVSLAVMAFLGLLLTPFTVLGTGLYVVGVDITGVLTVLGVLVILWALVFFFFSAHAIVVRNARVFEAMRASYALVHRYLLSVLGLLLVVLVIRLGTPLALQVFTETRWSVPFAIVVNSYVATGLIAATMLYFDSRSSTPFMPPAGRGEAGTSS